MPAASFTIEGIDELNILFQNFAPELTRSFHEITGKYAQSIGSEMNQIVPVRTGYLKSTIGSSSSTNSMQLYVSAHYAVHVNYGTRRMTGRPFFTGPVERQIPQMVEELNQAVAQYIQTNVRR